MRLRTELDTCCDFVLGTVGVAEMGESVIPERRAAKYVGLKVM